jgi:hypothetical protein
MNNRLQQSKVVLGLALALGVSGTIAAQAQIDTQDTCCLAQEWIAPVTGASPQSSEVICCLAGEWNADHYESIENRQTAPAQSSTDDTCCLANEWDAS